MPPKTVEQLQIQSIIGTPRQRTSARNELNRRLKLFIEMKNAAKALVKMSRNR